MARDELSHGELRCGSVGATIINTRQHMCAQRPIHLYGVDQPASKLDIFQRDNLGKTFMVVKQQT